MSTLLALQLILLHVKRLLQQLLLLLNMTTLQPSRDTGTRISSCIHDMLAIMELGVIQQRLDTRLREAPRAGIQGLFLTPDDCLGVLVGVEVVAQLRPGERVELFDASDGRVLDFVGFDVFAEGGVDLTRAEDHTIDVGGFVDGLAVFGIRDDPFEV